MTRADLLAIEAATVGGDVNRLRAAFGDPADFPNVRDDALAVELLPRHGADPAARTRIDHYATPLEEAERFGHAEGAAALRRCTIP